MTSFRSLQENFGLRPKNTVYKYFWSDVRLVAAYRQTGLDQFKLVPSNSTSFPALSNAEATAQTVGSAITAV